MRERESVCVCVCVRVGFFWNFIEPLVSFREQIPSIISLGIIRSVVQCATGDYSVHESVPRKQAVLQANGGPAPY